MAYEPRTYRRIVAPSGLTSFEVRVKETDLQVSALSDLTDEAEDLVAQARWQLEEFIRAHPYFAETFSPIDLPEGAPDIVVRMAEAAKVTRVGPMAAVAGAVAEHVAKGLAESSAEVIVENGGDLYLIGNEERSISLWAGDVGVQGVGIRIPSALMPIGVCTSSGSVGHSKSFGRADALTVLSHNGALADAAATALANNVREPDDIEKVIEAARNTMGVLGVLVTIDGHMGAWGNIHLISLEE